MDAARRQGYATRSLLFTPPILRGLTLRNQIVVSPMSQRCLRVELLGTLVEVDVVAFREG